MANKTDIDLQIIRLLLVEGEDVSIRDMARQIGISSGLMHYHMKKLYNLGILVRHELNEKGGYYTLQDLFTEDVKSTLNLLRSLCVKLDDCSDETLGECLQYLLRCSTFF